MPRGARAVLSSVPLTVWFAVLLSGVLVLFWLLATGVLAGVPDSPVKVVSTYAAPADSRSPTVLFLQPPVSTLKREDNSQAFSLQFANRTGNVVRIGPVTVRGTCFEILPLGTSPGELQPRQAAVKLYQFKAADTSRDGTAASTCLGEHMLTLQYGFTTVAPRRKHHRALPVQEERFLSTSPILITTGERARAERFYRIASALAIPLLLAIATFLIPVFQNQKAEKQKAQDIKLEVWKILYPKISSYIRRYYVLISRQMDLILNIELPQVAKGADGSDLMAAVFVLRSAYNVLGDTIGGFYFRTKSAEELCGVLSNDFLTWCRDLANDRQSYILSAKLVTKTDNTVEAKAKLAAAPALAAFHKAFQAKLVLAANRTTMEKYLRLMTQILDFEADVVNYPEWYPVPPKIKLSKFSFEGLGLSKEKKEDLEKAKESYRKEIRPECRA